MTAPAGAEPKLAAALDSIDLLLMTAQVVAADKIGNGFPAERFALTRRLDLARRAVADLAVALKTPARQPLDSAAAVRGGPVQSSTPTALTTAGSEAARPRAAVRAGGPPAPGADTSSLPACGEKWCCYKHRRAGVSCPSGNGPSFLLPQPVPWPGRPFPIYEVPAP